MLQDDATLVLRVLAGDRTAFSPLIDRHWLSPSICRSRPHTRTRWTMEGTHEGTFLGITPTHRRIVIRGVSSLLLRNDKIAEERRYWDASRMLHQLG
jgi:predicted ester cyclase